MHARRATEALAQQQRVADWSQVLEAARLIMDYLAEQPRARDTARGIAEWWIKTNSLVTEQALAYLLSQRFVVRIACNGPPLYGRNPDLAPAELVHLRDDLPAERA